MVEMDNGGLSIEDRKPQQSPQKEGDGIAALSVDPDASVPSETGYDRVTRQHVFPYEELDTYLDAANSVVWNYMKPSGLGCYSPTLLTELRQMQYDVHRYYKTESPRSAQPFRYFVCGSHIPGVFNLGGDLKLLAQCVRRQDRAQLRAYGRLCIDVLYSNYINMDLPIITMALVQGTALGGGFEAVMSFDLVVAERSARFGLPEVLFNLFPGMGAVSLLSRRVGQKRADEIIASGRIYTAEEMHDLGLVDVVADDGSGRDVLLDLIRQTNRRYNSRRAIFAANRRSQRLDYDELSDILEIWVDAALSLTPFDLRKMGRISSAQMRSQP